MRPVRITSSSIEQADDPTAGTGSSQKETRADHRVDMISALDYLASMPTNMSKNEHPCEQHDIDIEWQCYERLRPLTRKAFQDSKFNWCVCCLIEMAAEHNRSIPWAVRVCDALED